jgi:hypothetical protein
MGVCSPGFHPGLFGLDPAGPIDSRSPQRVRDFRGNDNGVQRVDLSAAHADGVLRSGRLTSTAKLVSPSTSLRSVAATRRHDTKKGSSQEAEGRRK